MPHPVPRPSGSCWIIALVGFTAFVLTYTIAALLDISWQGRNRRTQLLKVGRRYGDRAQVSPLAGESRRSRDTLVNVSRLITAYYAEKPDPSVAITAGCSSEHRDIGVLRSRRRSTSGISSRNHSLRGHLPVPESSNRSTVRCFSAWIRMRFPSRRWQSALDSAGGQRRGCHARGAR